MHGFSKDGAHLIFHDTFALTKIDFPKTVKSDEELGGASLSVGGNRLVVQVSRTHRCVHRSVDALLNLKWTPGNYGSFALLHDDKRALAYHSDSLDLVATEAAARVTLEWPAKPAKLGAVALGPTVDAESCQRWACAVSEDNLVAHYVGPKGLVYVGQISGAKKLTPVGALAVGSLAAVPVLAIDGETVFVCVFDRGNKRAKLCAIADGKVSAVQTLETISAPTFSGTRWCWQPDESTVLTAKWGALEKTARYELPVAARGAGEILAHGDERLCFARPLGEQVFDVRAKTVIDRKLSSRMKSAREIARRRSVRPQRWLEEENGAFIVTHVAVDRRDKKRVTWAPIFDLGNGSLSAFFAFGQEVHGEADRSKSEITISSYSGVEQLKRCALDDVRRAFDAVRRYDADVRCGLIAIEDSVREFCDAAKKSKKRETAGEWPRVFDEPAAKALLVTIFETEKSAEPIAVSAEDADRWAKTKVDAKWLAAQRFREGEGSDRWTIVQSLAGYLALELLGEEALSVLQRWYIDEPSAQCRESPFGTVGSLRVLTERYPATKRAVKEACKAAGEHGEAVTSELGW